MTKNNQAVSVEELKGTLAQAVGTFIGDGTDTFPIPNQPPMVTAYRETMTIGAPFTTVNPGGPSMSQSLYCLAYHTNLVNKATGAPMHQESGFWLLSYETSLFMKVIAIPRGISILAGGEWTLNLGSGQLIMNGSAEAGSPSFGISNQPFLSQVAPTTKFTTTITNTSDALMYKEDSVLTIQGQSLNHTDEANLILQS